MEKTSRNAALDLIRVVAVMCVFSVHFFLNTGFYDEIVLGKRMYLLTVARTGFMVCVPLFLLLTGYLMCQKTGSGRYYMGLLPTLGLYVLAAAVTVAYKHWFLGEAQTIWTAVKDILAFRANEYAWYVGMYMGLYLLIPYLNVLYRNLDKRQKQVLLLTLTLLTALPGMVNHILKVLPAWWSGIYPLTYYFLGAYIREYRVRLKKGWNLLLLLGAVALFGTMNYALSRNSAFVWGDWQGWGALSNMIMAVLLFLLLCDLEGLPKWGKALLAKLSGLCLGAYLCSCVFDSFYYAKLREAVPVFADRTWYFFVMVPLVAVSSFALSAVLKLVLTLCAKGIRLLRRGLRTIS